MQRSFSLHLAFEIIPSINIHHMLQHKEILNSDSNYDLLDMYPLPDIHLTITIYRVKSLNKEPAEDLVNEDDFALLSLISAS